MSAPNSPSPTEVPEVSRASPVVDRVSHILELMHRLDLPLMDFCIALFWGDTACRSDNNLAHTRNTFTKDGRLSQLLRTMHRPPRTGKGVGKQPLGAHDTLEQFAFSLVVSVFKRELEAYEKMTTLDPESLDLEQLQSITLSGIFNDLVTHAPRLYATLLELMETYDQQRRNVTKKPDTLAAVVLNIMVFSRSRRNGKLQNLLSMFLKAEGVPVRSFDVLNAFGISMSRTWADRMLSQFSAKAISEAQVVVSRGAFMVPSDNIRFNVHVESQRVDNQSQGVNCTAMTVVQLPDKFIDMVQHFDKRSIPRLLTPGGTLREIRWKDLLDMDALRSIHPFKVHLVLSALFSVRELADHPLRFDPSLQRPAAISVLPHGPEHKVKYWPLGTAQIDQSSYEGNALVIQEVLRQLDLDTAEHQQRIALNGVIPFAGDLLTGQRMKGLKSLLSEDDNGFDRLEWLLPVHGFFHNRMNLAYAIFNNHRGNSAGDGFAREINVLNRHGLTAKIKSPNVHTLDEFLLHFWTASTLDNWMWASGTNSVNDLVAWAHSVRDPSIFSNLANKIVRERQSLSGLSYLEDAHIAAQQGDSQAASRLAETSARTALVDQRLEARIIANSDLMLLQLERFAIKHGDVGLLDTLCSPLAIFFKGGGHGNYGNDMLDYIQWRKYESTPELRDLVRNCWLVNTQGHPDSFFPVDELQEHINREQREWHTRAGSNVSIDYLKKVTPAIPALAATIKHMAQHFDMPYRSHVHKSPESQADVRLMAKRFRKRKTSEYVAGRTIKESVNKPDNHSALGTALLQKEATWKKAFKERMLFLQHRSTLQNFESPEELELAVRMRGLRIENSLDS